jgi:hypothetical protein
MIPGMTFDRVEERRKALLWPIYVRRGCLVCGTQDRWCPDCHTCTRCGQGCDECAPYRRNYHHPSHKPTKPRGGPRG